MKRQLTSQDTPSGKGQPLDLQLGPAEYVVSGLYESPQPKEEDFTRGPWAGALEGARASGPPMWCPALSRRAAERPHLVAKAG